MQDLIQQIKEKVISLMLQQIALLQEKIKKMEKPPVVHLYETALSCLGMDASPNDLAPDELGCAETVNEIYQKAFGVQIGGDISTYRLFHALGLNKHLRRVDTPIPGAIIISPSGYGNGRLSNGHVGIMGENNEIMSNDSKTGKFVVNFTLQRWTDYYKGKGGYPVAFFIPISYPVV